MSYKNTIHYTKLAVKSLLEFAPVLSFFLVYELTNKNFFTATFSMIIMTIVYTFYTFTKDKRIPFLALFICLETSFFGSLTLFFKNPIYVQMRDTFYDVVLGATILVTGYIRTPIIKKFFGHIFDLDINTWVSLSYQWAVLLLSFGVTNELVRRNFSETIWVSYKFMVLGLTFIFGIYLLWKYRAFLSKDDSF